MSEEKPDKKPDEKPDGRTPVLEARGLVKARERIRGIVIVSVERATPVISPAYDIGMTEDELREIHLIRLIARASRNEPVDSGT